MTALAQTSEPMNIQVQASGPAKPTPRSSEALSALWELSERWSQAARSLRRKAVSATSKFSPMPSANLATSATTAAE